MSRIQKGTEVTWKWANGHAKGIVKEVFKKPIEKQIAGACIKRNASAEKPAYLIEQKDGSRALKSDSEISRAD